MQLTSFLIRFAVFLVISTSSWAQQVEVVDTAETTAKVISDGDALTVTQAGSVIVSNDTAVKFTDTNVRGDIQIDGTVESTSTSTGSEALELIGVGVDGSITINGTLQTAEGDGIDINQATGKIITGSIINNGTIISDGGDSVLSGIEFDLGVIEGDIINSATGSITSNGDNGIKIDGDEDTDFTDEAGVLEGQLINHGIITAACEAFDIDSNAWIKGGIINTGTLKSTEESIGVCAAIEIDEISRVDGGISNSGRIEANGDGIIIEDSTGMSRSLVTGNIVNTGTIEVGATAIDVEQSFVDGNIINDVDAVMLSGFDGINIDGDEDSDLTDEMGVVTGQLINRGRIVASDGEGFDLDGGAWIQGGIINSGTLIAKNDEIIEIDQGTRIDDGINNSGVMISENGDGIEIENGSVVNGDVINSGQIRADEESWDAFELRDDAAINGGLTNTGLIAAKDDALIFQSASTLTGNLDNQSGGIIIGTSEVEASVNMINAGQWFIKVNADFDNPTDTGEVGEQISTVTGTYTQSSLGLLGIASEAAGFSQLSVTGDVVFESSAKIHVDVKNDGLHLAVGNRLENVVQATGTLTAQSILVLDNSPDLAFVAETDGQSLSLRVVDQPPVVVPTLSVYGLLLLILMVLGVASVMGMSPRLN